MTEGKTPLDYLMEAEEFENDDEIELAGISGIPRDALARLLEFVLGKSDQKRRKWKVATLRLATLCHMLNIRDMRKLSLDKLGAELGCTRANLSLYSLAIVDELQIEKAFTGKRRGAREAYRVAALRSHEKRGHKMKRPPLPAPIA
jgi:hypothetical protein